MLYLRKNCCWLFVDKAPWRATAFKQLSTFGLYIVCLMKNFIASLLAAGDQSSYALLNVNMAETIRANTDNFNGE